MVDYAAGIMKKILFTFLLLSSLSGFSQSRDYKKLVSEIKILSNNYGKLNPFNDKSALKDFGLKYKDMKGIDENAFSKDRDSIDQYALIEFFRDKMVHKFRQIMEHKDFMKFGIPEIEGIDMVKSADNKLYNYTFDENMGGTYRSRVSVMQYTDAKNLNDSIAYSAFMSDGYYNITVINAKSGTKYLLEGEVVGCSTCMVKYIQLVHFENGKFVEDFNYRLLGRMSEDGILDIGYNDITQTIGIRYTTDDLTPSCKCGDSEGPTMEDGALPLQCYCLYKFDGETFVLEEQKPPATD